MHYRTAASTVVGAIILAVLGAVMGPQWYPTPLTDPVQVQSSSTAIGGAPVRQTYDVETSVVQVQLDGATVQAQLQMPVGVGHDVPAVVFVHGAGTGEFTRAFRAQSRSLAEGGIATLVPNKRLDTYTTRHRDYVAMAADYQHSVDLLRTVPGVDAGRVGVYAESEGAWIAPVMAAEDPSIAFVVLASAPVVPPRQQAAFAVDSYLRNTGVPSQVFRAIPRAVGMSLPGGGFEYADFDVSPYQRRMTQPVLMVYGTGDASMPLVQGAEQVIRDLAIAGNSAYTIRYYADADHGIRVDGAVLGSFLGDLHDWIAGLPGTAGADPRIAGAQPVQEYLASHVPQPTWLADGDLIVGLVLGSVGALVLLPLVGLGARILRRRRPTAGGGTGTAFPRGVARSIGYLAVASVATVAVLVWYLAAVAKLALDYQRNGIVVQGGWVGVRVLGLLAVLTAVLLLERLRAGRQNEGHLARGVVAHVVLWGTTLASAVLLVVMAYWGVYQLGL